MNLLRMLFAVLNVLFPKQGPYKNLENASFMKNQALGARKNLKPQENANNKRVDQ